MSFHSQDPRLEAVRRTDMGTFRNRLGGYVYIPGIFNATAAYNVVCGQTVMDGL